MKFKKLSMNNWIPYRGVNELHFSTDKNKHITFIRGRNKGGKTAIMRAIRWALYGNTGDTDSYKNPESLLNAHAKAENDNFFSVTLEIEKDQEDILITRSMESKGKRNQDFKQTFNIQVAGRSIMKDPDKYILELLAEDISDFFIFDGEKLDDFKQLTKQSSKGAQAIKDQIERVIRTPFLRSASKDLSSIKADISKKIGKDTTDERLKAMYDQRLKLETHKESFEAQLEIINGQASSFSETARQLQSDIDGYADSVEILANKKIEKNKIKAETKNLNLLKGTIQQQTDNYWKAVMSSILSKNKKKFNAKKDQIQKGIEHEIKLQMFKDSIKSGECKFCDEVLSESKKTKFQQYIDKEAQEEDTSLAAMVTFNRIQSLEGHDAKISIFSKTMSDYETSLEIIQRSEIALNDLNSALDGVDDDDLQSLLTKKTECDQEISRLERSIEDINRTLNGPNKDLSICSEKGIYKHLEDLDDLIGRIEEDQPQNDRNKELKLLAQNIEKVLKETIEQLSLNMRKSVEKLGNEMDKTITGDEHLNFEITEKFGLKVLNDFGDEIEDSAAGFEMIALSFFYGLKESTGLKGPLIIDTPFARVDLGYRESILKSLPEMSDQCVLIVHDGEIAPGSDLEQIIASDIGKNYEIEKKSKHLSQIIPK